MRVRFRVFLGVGFSFALILGAPGIASAHQLISARWPYAAYNGYEACGKSTVHYSTYMDGMGYSWVAGGTEGDCDPHVTASVGGAVSLQAKIGSTWVTCQYSNPAVQSTATMTIYVYDPSSYCANQSPSLWTTCSQFEAYISGAHFDTYSAYPLCSPTHS